MIRFVDPLMDDEPPQMNSLRKLLGIKSPILKLLKRASKLGFHGVLDFYVCDLSCILNRLVDDMFNVVLQ